MTLPPAPRPTRRTYVLNRGRELSYFGGCDYFRLSSHPRVLKALTTGLKRHGLSVSSSRFTTGNHPIYEQLEKSLARFFGTESATLASNGYEDNAPLLATIVHYFLLQSLTVSLKVGD